MVRAYILLACWITLSLPSMGGTQTPAISGPERWESAIAKFEEQDKQSPPEKGKVLFVGSSTILFSDPQRWFPDLKPLNRGFGGSFISDSVYYAGRIILPYEPGVIVFHAGGNDITAGKTPEAVSADFGALVRKVHAALPKTRIIYMSLMASRSRLNLWPQMSKANALIEEFCKKDDRLWYVDVSRFLQNDQKEPRDEIFRADKLHLNSDGYQVWSSVLSPVLTRMLYRSDSPPAKAETTKEPALK
jgi:lysophospholipase L1-like esterase